MKWLFGLMLVLALLPISVVADEGHGAPPSAPHATLAPRLEAHSESFELVGVLEGEKLILYLDRFATNEPVTGAVIEIESGAFKAMAQSSGEGIYTASVAALTKPGQYALVFTIRAADETDLLNGTLGVPPPPGASSHLHDWTEWLVWIAGALVALAGIAWLLRRRMARKTAALAIIAVAIVPVLLAVATSAHADEGHGADKKGAAAYAPVGAGENATSQRLADGGVFMPKPVQRQLGIRTVVAEIRELAQSIELNGRVIADPNAGGRVQSTQSGRVEPGPRGLPTLGQKVSKGEVLAYIKPVANAIELGNQRAQLAEINSQYGLTGKKVTRLEALEGSVPQKEIDAARAEFASLGERKAAVGGSLSNREALIAPGSGVISAASAIAGQVVEAREVLFEIVDPQRLMVEALAYDAVIVADIAGASGVPPGGAALQLAFVGGARQLREQALPLLFRIKPPLPPLAVGQPLKVVAQTRQTIKGVAMPLAALTRNSSGDTVLWVHAGAETFVPRKVRFQALDGANVAVTDGVAAGERIAIQGASALAQVR
jgi:cobalt-zinc-cadmium efflux system membrane fusion protein